MIKNLAFILFACFATQTVLAADDNSPVSFESLREQGINMNELFSAEELAEQFDDADYSDDSEDFVGRRGGHRGPRHDRRRGPGRRHDRHRGPGRHRGPRGPHRRGFICYAENARRMVFSGWGHHPHQAQRRAWLNCKSRSIFCRNTGCR